MLPTKPKPKPKPKPMPEHAVGDNLPLFTTDQRLELRQFSRPLCDRSSSSYSLAELLNCVDEVSFSPNLATAFRHYILEMTSSASSYSGSHVPASRPSFLRYFNNLTYSVNVRRKLALSAFLPLRNRVALSYSESPPQHQLGTKVLLNNILVKLGKASSWQSSERGTVTLNGQALDSRLLKVISAYVMQDDLLFPMLTVDETLMFSAEFRLPRSLFKSGKKARVQALIDQLGLHSAANTVIGDEGHRGVSGGERRQVSIGIDIIHDPIILFLDEPTSGLDSTSAFMVDKVLQRIAQSGSIVIMSIHQPSYRILGLLDRLIFLSHGNTVFTGPPSDLPSFFSEFGHPIPKN